MPHRKIQPLYDALVGRAENAAEKDLMGDETSKRLADLSIACRAFLITIGGQWLESKVAGKRYFMFVDPVRKKTSRPVNADLYIEDLSAAKIRSALDCEFGTMTASQITTVI